MKQRRVILILHDIRSSYNVGSIFRTAESIGVDKIILSGYTPAPMDKFGKENSRLVKTSLGSEKIISWEKAKNIGKLLESLKKEKYKIMALEQSKKSVDYKKVKTKGNTAIIIGNEVKGIPSSVLRKSDVIAEISMKGKKESLNVGVATGIALFRWLDK